MDIYHLNQVNASNAVLPGYRPDPRQQKIEFYLSMDGKVIIVGVLDNNYIYWLSVTSVGEKEINAAIFDSIANEDYTYVTTLNNALQEAGYSYEMLKGMYHGCLFRTGEPGMEWRTPFGHYYGSDQIEENGQFFAQDLFLLPNVLKKKCEAREARGAYVDVMKTYAKLLKVRTGNPYRDYDAARHIIDIIQEETYLKFSENSEVKSLYEELCELSSSLYNAYMTMAR